MPEQNEITVHCPHCGKSFALAEALQQQLTEAAAEKMQAQQRQERQAWEEKNRNEWEAKEAAAERKRVEDIEAARREAAAAKNAAEAQRSQIEEARKRAAEAEQAANAAKLEVERQKEEMARKTSALDLTVQTQVNEKVLAREAEIRIQAERSAQESFLAESRRKDEIILRNKLEMEQINEQMRKLREGGSQQLQGEVGEVNLESELKTAFPGDGITPVEKGVEGADAVQEVRDALGRKAGVILWESKRTKAWGGNWIERLKENMRAAEAEVGILVSEAMPKEFQEPGFLEGVWVCSPRNARAAAALVRARLLAVAEQRQAASGLQEKRSALYAYMTSEGFKQCLLAISDAFRGLEGQIAKEKRAFQKQWKIRETLLNRAWTATMGIAGSVQGIAGGDARYLEALESVALLGAGDADLEDEEDDDGEESEGGLEEGAAVLARRAPEGEWEEGVRTGKRVRAGRTKVRFADGTELSVPVEDIKAR